MTPCSRCESPASRSCLGCIGAPPYPDHIGVVGSYCSTKCQKGDWTKHKDLCNAFQTRKRLGRVATLLKDALLAVRRVAYPREVRVDEHSPPNPPVVRLIKHPRGFLCRVPDQVVDGFSPAVQDGFLLSGACVEVVTLHFRLTEALFGDLHVTVKEVGIYYIRDPVHLFLQTLSKGTDEEFGEKRARFVEWYQMLVDSVVATLYTPQGIVERESTIDTLLMEIAHAQGQQEVE